jgi:hypothetical protein
MAAASVAAVDAFLAASAALIAPLAERLAASEAWAVSYFKEASALV